MQSGAWERNSSFEVGVLVEAGLTRAIVASHCHDWSLLGDDNIPDATVDVGQATDLGVATFIEGGRRAYDVAIACTSSSIRPRSFQFRAT